MIAAPPNIREYFPNTDFSIRRSSPQPRPERHSSCLSHLHKGIRCRPFVKPRDNGWSRAFSVPCWLPLMGTFGAHARNSCHAWRPIAEIITNEPHELKKALLSLGWVPIHNLQLLPNVAMCINASSIYCRRVTSSWKLVGALERSSSHPSHLARFWLCDTSRTISYVLRGRESA